MSQSALRGLPLVALAALAALAPGAAAADAHHDQIAANVVNQSLAVQPGEVVLINGNPDQVDLLAALQVAVFKAGGQPVITLNIPQANKRAVMESPIEHLKRLPTAQLHLTRMADATISAGSVQDPKLFADVPEERLAALRQANAPLSQAISTMRTRNVSLGQTGGIPTDAYARSLGADPKEVQEIFWRAVGVPPASLAETAERLAGRLAPGTTVHLSSAAGTDLTFTLAELPARINAGRTADVDAPSGPSSVWLPAGEAYACVEAGSASGTLVVPHLNFRGNDVENLRLTFSAGQLTGLTADAGAETLRQFLDSSSPATKVLSVVDFGVNPESRTPDGSRVYSWEMAGMVTVGLGNNSWAGGTNHADGALTLHLPALTAKVGEETVVRDGKLGV